MKQIIIFIGLIISIGCYGQKTTRGLKVVSFSGSGYELGVQHGKALKNEIRDIILAWKKNTAKELGKESDIVLKEFLDYADFEEAIKQWTPDLYEEIKGIADGSEQQLNDVLVLNLLDEFWVYINNLNNHHCSGAGFPARNGQPAYISQNMDLEKYTDGFQVLMCLKRRPGSPEQLILTYPGLIALNGLNEEGIGVCVNTLMQLKAAPTGLPVAFVVRYIINSTSINDLLSFIQTINHASGQNYIIGIKGEVFDFEASANKVVRFNPNNPNGSVYHTNHPIVNDDIKPWFKQFDPQLDEELKPIKSNSHLRFKSVEMRLKSDLNISESVIKVALSSKDDANNPVCRTLKENERSFTFASVIMSLGEKPSIQILAGPPDESDYKKFDFSKNQ